MVKWLLPWTKYLYIAGTILAAVLVWYVTSNHYETKIAKSEREYALQVVKYTDRLIENDVMYSKAINKYRLDLLATQKRLNDELKKPAYLCPIPDDGIKLLNDSANSTGQGDSK